MRVGNLNIPKKLASLLTQNSWNKPSIEKLEEIFRKGIFNPVFYDLDTMIRETKGVRRNLEPESDNVFAGEEGLGIGIIDMEKLILIGDTGIEEPFGLYYETIEPLVIYLDTDEKEGVGYWRVIAKNFAEFWNMLSE